jgi:hypothetical protein
VRVGHAGVAVAAKRFGPRVPLWLLLCAAYAPDIIEVSLWPFGVHNRELSHSLISVGLGATLLAASYALLRRDTRGAICLASVYVLHWPADFITGHKPTWPGGPTVGLDLYDRPVLVWIVDLAVLAGGCWLYYMSARRAGTARADSR